MKNRNRKSSSPCVKQSPIFPNPVVIFLSNTGASTQTPQKKKNTLSAHTSCSAAQPLDHSPTATFHSFSDDCLIPWRSNIKFCRGAAPPCLAWDLGWRAVVDREHFVLLHNHVVVLTHGADGLFKVFRNLRSKAHLFLSSVSHHVIVEQGNARMRCEKLKADVAWWFRSRQADGWYPSDAVEY